MVALATVRARGCDPCSGGRGGVPTTRGGCRSIAMTLMMILPRYIGSV
jgi:hypothetical protein